MEHTRRGLFELIAAAMAGRRVNRALAGWLRRVNLREQYRRGRMSQRIPFDCYYSGVAQVDL